MTLDQSGTSRESSGVQRFEVVVKQVCLTRLPRVRLVRTFTGRYATRFGPLCARPDDPVNVGLVPNSDSAWVRMAV